MIDASTYHSLQITLTKRFLHGLYFGPNYSLATNTPFGDASSTGSSGRLDNNNLRAEKGPTPYAVSNNFNAGFICQLSFQKRAGLNDRGTGLLIGGCQLSGISSANDDLPFTFQNGSLSFPSSRPYFAPGANPVFSSYTSTSLFLNKAAFFAPPIVTASTSEQTPEDVGNDVYCGPSMWDVETSLVETFDLMERLHLLLRGDFFNVHNHTNLVGLVTNIPGGSFGKLTAATARTVQIGGRLDF